MFSLPYPKQKRSKTNRQENKTTHLHRKKTDMLQLRQIYIKNSTQTKREKEDNQSQAKTLELHPHFHPRGGYITFKRLFLINIPSVGTRLFYSPKGFKTLSRDELPNLSRVFVNLYSSRTQPRRNCGRENVMHPYRGPVLFLASESFLHLFSLSRVFENIYLHRPFV